MERVRGHIRKDMAANIAESATTRRVGLDDYLFTIHYSLLLPHRGAGGVVK